MYHTRLHKLIIIAFACFLGITTLGMVLTVSANRSEPGSITHLTVPVITTKDTQLSNYSFPTILSQPDDVLPVITTDNDVTSASINSNETFGSKTIASVKTKPKTILNQSKLTTKKVPSISEDTEAAKTAVFSEAFRQRVFELTNDFRVSEGLPPLKINTVLTKNASAYSESMLKINRLSHTDVRGCDLRCRFKRDGFTATAWGENLAYYSFEDEPTVEEVAQFFMREWQKSAGHKANLVLTEFLETGIGIAKNDNSIYVAVYFALP